MNQSVLLVDDDQDIIAGVGMRLMAMGYETHTAHDGEQGIERALELQPDAIVMDVRMPKVSGLEALVELQGNTETKHIPIIMLSASLVDQKMALDSGARYFLKKPYQGKELAAALQVAMSPAVSSI